MVPRSVIESCLPRTRQIEEYQRHSGGFVMKVRDVMTADPHCCSVSDNAQTAAKIMARDEVGAVPVIVGGNHRKLIGIVTDRDLCISVIAGGADPCSTTLQQCMSTNPVSCREGDDIQTVSDLMKEHQVRRIPVVDSQSKVVGIVATADLAREEEVDRTETGEVLAQISQDTTHRVSS